MKIARIFPRKTKASPDDPMAFFGPPEITQERVKEAHISVTFTYDIADGLKLRKAWEPYADKVRIGGPAYGDPGIEFIPGRYLKQGYVITSRGCPNNCWFCQVPGREGRDMRELPITEGWNVLDSNLLACSDMHISRVFDMLSKQKNPIEFTGGLEAKRLKDWHIDLLWGLRPSQMFFAYDTLDDLEPLIEAGRKLRYANFTRRHLRAYVLIGWPRDTVEDAERRLIQTWRAGFMPMAMLWKNNRGDESEEWRKFQRLWARPPITKKTMQGFGMRFYHNDGTGNQEKP